MAIPEPLTYAIEVTDQLIEEMQEAGITISDELMPWFKIKARLLVTGAIKDDRTPVAE